MTHSHEELIMRQYESMLQRIVSSFRRRCSYPTTSEADLLQEARIAFLEHIRMHNEHEYTRCYRTILHALFDAVRRDYPVYVPYGVFRTHDFKKISTISYDAVEVTSDNESFENIEAASTVSAFLGKLTKQEQQLIKHKIDGMTNREAGQRVGLSDVQVSRALRRIRKKQTHTSCFNRPYSIDA